jgi:hypothetical protein
MPCAARSRVCDARPLAQVYPAASLRTLSAQGGQLMYTHREIIERTPTAATRRTQSTTYDPYVAWLLIRRVRLVFGEGRLSLGTSKMRPTPKRNCV